MRFAKTGVLRLRRELSSAAVTPLPVGVADSDEETEETPSTAGAPDELLGVVPTGLIRVVASLLIAAPIESTVALRCQVGRPGGAEPQAARVACGLQQSPAPREDLAQRLAEAICAPAQVGFGRLMLLSLADRLGTDASGAGESGEQPGSTAWWIHIHSATLGPDTIRGAALSGGGAQDYLKGIAASTSSGSPDATHLKKNRTQDYLSAVLRGGSIAMPPDPAGQLQSGDQGSHALKHAVSLGVTNRASGASSEALIELAQSSESCAFAFQAGGGAARAAEQVTCLYGTDGSWSARPSDPAFATAPHSRIFAGAVPDAPSAQSKGTSELQAVLGKTTAWSRPWASLLLFESLLSLRAQLAHSVVSQLLLWRRRLPPAGVAGGGEGTPTASAGGGTIGTNPTAQPEAGASSGLLGGKRRELLSTLLLHAAPAQSALLLDHLLDHDWAPSVGRGERESFVSALALSTMLRGARALSRPAPSSSSVATADKPFGERLIRAQALEGAPRLTTKHGLGDHHDKSHSAFRQGAWLFLQTLRRGVKPTVEAFSLFAWLLSCPSHSEVTPLKKGPDLLIALYCLRETIRTLEPHSTSRRLTLLPTSDDGEAVAVDLTTTLFELASCIANVKQAIGPESAAVADLLLTVSITGGVHAPPGLLLPPHWTPSGKVGRALTLLLVLARREPLPSSLVRSTVAAGVAAASDPTQPADPTKPSTVAGYEVAGAGLIFANGYFERDGEYNSAPLFKKGKW